MQFSCNRKELLAAAKRTAKAASISTKVSVLTGMLIQADADNYERTLTATNMEIAISCTVPAPVASGGSIVINAMLFVEMLSLLDGQTVEVTAHPNEHISISSGATQYLVAGLPAESFPPLQIPEQAEAVPICRLKGVAKQTVFAAAKSGNLAMQCIKLETRQSSFRAIGCDGSILSSSRREISDGKDMQLLIPSSSLSVLAGLVEDEEELLLSADEKQAVVRSPEHNMVFTARLGNGSYLDADGVLAGIVKQYEAVVDAAEFRRALDGVCTLPGSVLVNLTFSLGEISMSSETEVGTAKDAAAAQVFAVTPEEGFHYQGRKLLQGIQTMQGPIRLSLSDTGILLVTSAEQSFMQTPSRKLVVKSKKKTAKAEKTTKKSKAKAA